MHESASTLIENWSGLVGHILGDLDLDHLARSTRALRRRRGVPASAIREFVRRIGVARAYSTVDVAQLACGGLGALPAADRQA